MDPRDQELDEMLDGLRGDAPTDWEIKRWQMTTLAFARMQRRGRRFAVLFAAAVLGALVGGAGVWALLRQHPVNPASHSVAATFELTYDKLD